jgi:hypothetical protein
MIVELRLNHELFGVVYAMNIEGPLMAWVSLFSILLLIATLAKPLTKIGCKLNAATESNFPYTQIERN